MTDTKTPVRRTARTQPSKTRSAAAIAPAPAVAKKTAAVKSSTTGIKATPGAAKKPVRKAVATPASVKPSAASKPKVTPPAPLTPAMVPPAATSAAPKARTQAKGDSFKLRMLVDQVVKATGGKKKGVKDMVEATLSRLGEALARGDELNLPGFGKVRVVKTDARDGTAIMTLKLRQDAAKSGAAGGQKVLAETGDDD